MSSEDSEGNLRTLEPYQMNLSSTGANTLISYGLPRAVRIRLQAYRY